MNIFYINKDSFNALSNQPAHCGVKDETDDKEAATLSPP